MHLTRKRLFKPVSLLLVAAAVVAGMIIFFKMNGTAIQNALVNLDLVPKPEKMTELFFSDPANLPGSATNNQTINFAFVIHNLETADYRYVYEVSVNANSTKQIVDSGEVLVKDNQYYVKNEQFNLMNSPGPQEVVVELINLHQSIDFWIGNN